MKGIVKKMPFRWLGRFNGITIVPYIFIYKDAYKDNPTRYAAFINHENIHVRQVSDEMKYWSAKCGKLLGKPWGWTVWYTKYLCEFAWNLIKYPGNAYRNISYEREAYGNQWDLSYLDDRPQFEARRYKDGFVCDHPRGAYLYKDNRVEGQSWYRCPDCNSMYFKKD
jgi:hypothetical protein